ncbi:ABC transporter substrate-binding protein [Rhodococcus sp. NPDC003318]|uniref:ABC transporter substrate-binding protein n=1 Tax=Rhodococcus sp. NPDC003318 TaxID=3364503 RepID=UPI0036B16D65
MEGAELQVHVGANVTNPALADVRIRQAIAYAVDCERIVTEVFRGSGYPVNLPSPSRRRRTTRPATPLTSEMSPWRSGFSRNRTAEIERNLAALGTGTIASSVGHPQTCGRNERAHRTLRKWLTEQTRRRNTARPADSTVLEVLRQICPGCPDTWKVAPTTELAHRRPRRRRVRLCMVCW